MGSPSSSPSSFAANSIVNWHQTRLCDANPTTLSALASCAIRGGRKKLNEPCKSLERDDKLLYSSPSSLPSSDIELLLPSLVRRPSKPLYSSRRFQDHTPPFYEPPNTLQQQTKTPNLANKTETNAKSKSTSYIRARSCDCVVELAE